MHGMGQAYQELIPMREIDEHSAGLRAAEDLTDDESDETGTSQDLKSVNLVTRDKDRMIVPVTIGGILSEALIDTGATTSMVHADWIVKNDISILEEDSVLRGFGVENHVDTIGVVALDVSLRSVPMRPCNFFVVVSTHPTEIPFVLGCDFLLENELLVVPHHGYVSQCVGGELVKISCEPRQELSQQLIYEHVQCVADCDVTIPIDQVTCVPVSSRYDVSKENLVLMEGVDGARHLEVVPGLSNGVQEILVAHQGVKPLKIQKGDVIGAFSSVMEDSENGEVCIGAVDWKPDAEDVNGVDLVGAVDLTHLKLEERLGVEKMLREVVNVLSTGDSDVGLIDVQPHEIKLTDYTPIYQKPRRFNERVTQRIEEQCRELEMLNIIEASKSPWASPVVPIMKKDGSLRLCVDYRKLNEVTIPDRYPVPNLTDSVFSLHGVKYFTSLDLVRGYYQLGLSEASREYTAFATPKKLYHFLRCPFGLRNAPAAFQRAMQQVISTFPPDKVIVYIDDVLIMSCSFDEHLQLVQKVLTTLMSYGIKVKPSKCSWFKDEVEYLGHIVSSRGVKKSPKYVEKVCNFPRPNTVGELRQFLGLANFQRKFVPNFSSVQKPLSEKTSGLKRKKLLWDDEMVAAFDQLKLLISEDVMLSFPDYSPDARPLQVFVDASGYGAGACLVQEQEGHTRIIAYISMTFSPAERKYPTIERELAGLRWAVKNLRPFLLGFVVEIFTDHQPLIYLHNMQILDSRLARTLEDLAGFDYKIIYLPGNENVVADWLSRIDPPSVEELEDRSVDWQSLPVGVTQWDVVTGGGDSMFQSLQFISEQLSLSRGPYPTHVELRRSLVGEVLNHETRYGLRLDKEGRKKLKLMSHSGILPSMNLLCAFAFLFGCSVLVHFGPTNPIWFVSPVRSTSDETVIHLQCLAGVHFNPATAHPLYDVPEVPDKGDSVADKDERSDCVTGESFDEADEVSQLLSVDSRSCPWHARSHISCILMTVSGSTFCVLLDTGAQVSCVTQQVVDKLGGQIDYTRRMSIGALGACKTVSLGTSETRIVLDEGKDSVIYPLHVVDNDVFPACIILGIDFMKAYSISIDFSSLCYRVSDGPPIALPYLNNSATKLVALSNQLGLGQLVKVVCVGEPGESLSFGVERDGDGECVGFSSVLDSHEVIRLQRNCVQLQQVIEALEGTDSFWPPAVQQFKRYRDEMFLVNDVLIHRRQTVDRYVVPVNMLVEVMLVVHYHMAHVGRQKLMELVGQHLWHPSMRSIAEDITSTCDNCQRFKVYPIVTPPMLKIQTTRPFELLAVDLVLLPKCGPYIGCLVAVDHFTKWLCVAPITCKTGSHVARQFEHRILQSCVVSPEKVLSDNGGEFKSFEFSDVLNKYNISHVYTTAYKPSSNGLVERANRTLLELLRVDGENKTKWIDMLSKVVMIHNTTFQTAIGCSPSERILRQAHDGRDPLLVPSETAQLWREGSSSFLTYIVGQKVMKKVVRKGNETSEKFRPRFDGPYVIEVVNLNGVTYQISHIQTGMTLRAHHSQLRKYNDPPVYLREHPFFMEGEIVEHSRVQTPPREEFGFGNGTFVLCSGHISETEKSSEEETSDGSSLSEESSDDEENDEWSEDTDRDSHSSTNESGSDSSCTDSICSRRNWWRKVNRVPRFLYGSSSSDDSSEASIIPEELQLTQSMEGGHQLHTSFEDRAPLADLQEPIQPPDEDKRKRGAVPPETSHISVMDLARSLSPIDDVNDWNMILPDTSDLPRDSVQVVKDRCLEILDAGLRGLNSTSSILKLALSLSSEVSASKRSCDAVETSGVLDKLKELEELVAGLNGEPGGEFESHSSDVPDVSPLIQRTECVPPTRNLYNLIHEHKIQPLTVISDSSEDVGEESDPRSEAGNRMALRSRGPVRDMPNVQDGTLEYRRRSRLRTLSE